MRSPKLATRRQVSMRAGLFCGGRSLALNPLNVTNLKNITLGSNQFNKIVEYKHVLLREKCRQQSDHINALFL